MKFICDNEKKREPRDKAMLTVEMLLLSANDQLEKETNYCQGMSYSVREMQW